MSTSQRSRARFAVAAVALFELCLVTASPLWHHDHRGSAPGDLLAPRGVADLHVCRTGDHVSQSENRCPICLSQRLLAHGLTEPAAEPSVPAAVGMASLVDVSAAGRAPANPILPRGPPAA